jgi:hypothetical protein
VACARCCRSPTTGVVRQPRVNLLGSGLPAPQHHPWRAAGDRRRRRLRTTGLEREPAGQARRWSRVTMHRNSLHQRECALVGGEFDRDPSVKPHSVKGRIVVHATNADSWANMPSACADARNRRLHALPLLREAARSAWWRCTPCSRPRDRPACSRPTSRCVRLQRSASFWSSCWAYRPTNRAPDRQALPRFGVTNASDPLGEQTKILALE